MSEIAPTPPPQPLHSECEKMHRYGYCVCTMVECGYCDLKHPPHKACAAKALALPAAKPAEPAP